MPASLYLPIREGMTGRDGLQDLAQRIRQRRRDLTRSGQLDGLLQEQYKQCWNYIALGGAQKYIPQIKVEFSREGGLVGQPALLNVWTQPR